VNTEPESLEARVVRLCRDHGWTLATAESCTGGLLASRITDVPGASEVFCGGVVAYNNAMKMSLLGVGEEVLRAHGAVSPETAAAMAEGACKCLGADLAAGVTGIAGPGGGTTEKPVGLVYIAVAGADGTRVARHEFSGCRAEVKAQSVEAALAMLLEELG